MDSFFKNINIQLSEVIDADSEFIPLLSAEEEELIAAEKIPEILPILPLKNTVLFPGVVIPITVSRDKSIQLVREVYKSNRVVGVVSQKNSDIEDPSFDDLHRIGTFATIIKILQMPDGSTTVIIQGKKRLEIKELVTDDPYFKARVVSFDSKVKIKAHKQFNALIATIKDLAIQIVKLSPNVPSEAAFAINNIDGPAFLVNFISANLNIDNQQKQGLLETLDLNLRANMVLEHLTRELQMVELKNQIQSKVKVDIDKQQRDYFLNQQLKTIQEELGGNPYEQQIAELKERAKKKKWSKQIQEVFEKEILKLQRINPAAMDFSVHLNYIETLIDLPWNEFSKDSFDLIKAKRILDRDHYGLEKIKDRILEYLAVLKLKGNMKSPILCFVGPPGVGKTSLGKSIAEAVGRQYVRMSLGGLRDEAEIRGHRKTYVGAMPGRIIQNLRKAKKSNPVFVLDEIDKIGFQTFSGDPSSAMLEVLDPEQNATFQDNYLEVEYDLSNIMFIATANSLATVQPALRDRMEIIQLGGYIVEEKIQIARKHLVPKQLADHGLEKGQLKFSNQVLEKIIEDYTRESGVRTLEKTIAKVVRARARDIVSNQIFLPDLRAQDVERILGAPTYSRDYGQVKDMAGVMTGLAWTWAGGEVLFIEVSVSRGKGQLTMTGNLGDVMKESATLAYEYLKSHAHNLEINPVIFEKYNVHIHVPEGATPKDGPSAGITMFAALASAFTQRSVKPGVAMTGEITLRGRVLPVGGIKEKILAAKRNGINTIILSEENKKDVKEINELYLKGLEFVYIREMIEVVDLTMDDKLIKKPMKFEV
jgi:ATP-dependent Lon protease